MKVSVYQQGGQKKGDITLSSEMFEAPVRKGLMHLAVVRQMANARVDTAMVKTRAAVRGGGRKPYRQKGTGRARQGSIRSPHYRGGGIVFGPNGSRNYEKNMPKKQRRKALFSALSLRAADKDIVIIDSFESRSPKTSLFVEMLEKLPVKKKVLFVISEANLVLQKSSSNLPNVRTIFAQYLNVVDVLWADTVLFVEPALQKAQEIFVSS